MFRFLDDVNPTKTDEIFGKSWQLSNANKLLEVRHIPKLVCDSLDMALTPRNIKSGFSSTGIFPLNPNVFTEVDFIQAVEENAAAVSCEIGESEEDQRRIVVNPADEGDDILDIGAFEEVSTSEPSTSHASLSRSTSVASILSDVGPLQPANQEKSRIVGEKP